MRITAYKHSIKKEPLLSSFGFKGRSLSELWQSNVILQGENKLTSAGSGVQSVLWSDANIFVRYGEERGNALMSELTKFALEQAGEFRFAYPSELMDQLLPVVHEYGKELTQSSDLSATFSLNALVPVDHAAWALYAGEQRQFSFFDLLSAEDRRSLSAKHAKVAGIPLVSYGMEEWEIRQLLQEGYFLLKLKIGSDPDQDGDQEKMLEWDKQRLSMVHHCAEPFASEYTRNGRIAYYLDANGRYESVELVERFLEYADQIGALEQIVLFEEPFPESLSVDVSDLPVRFAADESVHSMKDARERIEMGFTAFTLKPVAKTMSFSLKVAALAHEHNLPCFCADLTVNPILVDWNKNMAARLPALPGLKIGAMETNGQQNYKNWEEMLQSHPQKDSAWVHQKEGLFTLDEAFFQTSGGVFNL